MKKVLYIGMILIALLAGCDLLEPSGFEREIIVSGYLVAGEPLPDIRISHTLPVSQRYNPDSAAVLDADVRVQRISETDDVIKEYRYRLIPNSSGIYTPYGLGSLASAPADSVIYPLETYRLIADVPGFGTLTSTTTVPDTFSVATFSADTVTYQAADPLTFVLTPTDYPGRQSVFVFNTIALDGFEHQLTPFARSLLEDGDELTINDLRERVSPILNEENLQQQSDGTLEMQFPWLAIYFYGRNEVNVHALDDNMYDFVRSRSVQQGGSTRPPGEIPNVIDHIEGGRGIFGSYAEATVQFYVAPRDDARN